MEKRAEQSEGNKKLRRQENDAECRRNRNAPCGKLICCGDDTGSSSSVGNHIHNGNGIELHTEHLHRDAPEVFRFSVHLLGFCLIRLIYFQRCQSLKVFQKPVAEPCISAPVFTEQPLGDFLYGNNGNRYEGNAAEEDECRLKTDRRQHRKQGERRKEAVEKLRQVSAEVYFKLFNPI